VQPDSKEIIQKLRALIKRLDPQPSGRNKTLVVLGQESLLESRTRGLSFRIAVDYPPQLDACLILKRAPTVTYGKEETYSFFTLIPHLLLAMYSGMERAGEAPFPPLR
jgi:hypothetical protein